MKIFKHTDNSLEQSDRGVSPVIGVILMVAITVILAAVIATFVLSLGEGLSDPAPQASWQVSESLSDDVGEGETVLEIRHTGGDNINADDLTLNLDVEDEDALEVEGIDGTISAGDTIEVVTSDDLSGADNIITSGDSATLVWESGDTTSSLASHTFTGDVTYQD